MYLSELQQKDIISINDGRKIGKIIDVEINEDGSINIPKVLRPYMGGKEKIEVING